MKKWRRTRHVGKCAYSQKEQYGGRSSNVLLNENDIPGAKLCKKVDAITKTETVLCTGCRNLSGLRVDTEVSLLSIFPKHCTSKCFAFIFKLRLIIKKAFLSIFLARITLYISMGSDKEFLKDPSGVAHERKTKESLDAEQNLFEKNPRNGRRYQ